MTASSGETGGDGAPERHREPERHSEPEVHREPERNRASGTLDLPRALLDPAAYPDPVDRVELEETHASWVFLAGERAYKVKKPVDFGFLDFSTLSARHRFCDEEIRLNRRLAPALYLDVVPIAGPPGAPRIGGAGEALEYAVAMRRFRGEDRLDRVARAGRLEPRHVDALAVRVARFHAAAPSAAPDARWGSPDEILGHAVDNFHALDVQRWPRPAAAGLADRLAALEAWTVASHARIAPAMAARRNAGFVRECHGDMHLANLVLIDDEVLPFDALEFSPGLRWIDVVSETAFVVMDLHRHRLPGLARRFLDRWLEWTGDHAGLVLLPFYLVYRAMVRAKVAALRAAQAQDDEQRAEAMAEALDSIALAEALATPARPAVAITCGVSGSGKSRIAQALLERGDWIRVRSDIERKRLAGLAPDARSRSARDRGLYDAQAGDRTYERLEQLAAAVLDAGFPVIVDATFLQRRRRRAFRELAAGRRVPFAILAADAPLEVLEHRVRVRAAAGVDPSEATLEVLREQLRTREDLDDDERAVAVVADTGSGLDPARLQAVLDARIAGQA